MIKQNYLNFVKASEYETLTHEARTSTISGIEAQRMYLEELGKLEDTSKQTTKNVNRINDNQSKNLSKREDIHVSDKDLFLSVQNNDVETLIPILNAIPDKLNVLDDYGWSLLMIACQANAADVVKELLERGIDTHVRDKAGNSACSLVIKNRNYMLADILFTYKKVKQPHGSEDNTQNVYVAEEFSCEICNSTFPDKTEHLSSTVHNINASKGKKVPSHYVIPQTNKGYQLMLKVGWDRESGLGKDGAGKKYPIKAIQKKDRKGLGHEIKRETQSTQNHVQYKNKRKAVNDYNRQKRLEIKFRREFY